MSNENPCLSKPSASTGRCIQKCKEAILKEWNRKVRAELPAAAMEHQIVLYDSLPVFIDELATALLSQESTEEAVPQEIAYHHASQRASLTQFDLNQVLSEYRILLHVIFSVLDQAGIDLNRKDRDFIIDFIQRGQQFSAINYVELVHQREAKMIQNLRTSEALHRETFEQAAVGMAQVGIEGQWLQVNQKLCDIVRYTKDEILKLSFQEITHPDDLPGDLAKTQELINGSIPHYQIEKRYIRKDSSIVWVNLTVSLVRDPYGNPLYFISVIQDISQRKDIEISLAKSNRKMEEAFFTLNAFIESSPLGVALFDQNLNYVQINSVMAKLTGCSPEDLIGKSIYKALSHDLAVKIGNRVLQAFKTGQPVLNIEGKLSDPITKKDRTFLMNFFPITQVESAHLIGMNSFEITERKEFEEQLQLSLKKLHDEREIRSRVVSMITHDLKTPLTTIKLNAQTLLRFKKDDVYVTQVTGKIINSVNRTEKMIQDLLDANLLNAGAQLPVQFESINLNSILLNTLEDLKQIHGKDRFGVIIPSMTIRGYWDGNGIRRIIENLCNNAIKYGAKDKVVQVQVECNGESEIELSVHNEGEPIPKEELGTLFKPFKRTPSAQSGQEKGWGIGLALVKGVVEAHHGSLEVQSATEKGTTFKIILPIDARNPSRQHPMIA